MYASMQYFNDPDTIRPTLASYSLDKFGKGVRSVCCVLNPDTGNTNTLVGGGDGTVSFINQSLNKVGDVNEHRELCPSYRCPPLPPVTVIARAMGGSARATCFYVFKPLCYVCSKI